MPLPFKKIRAWARPSAFLALAAFLAAAPIPEKPGAARLRLRSLRHPDRLHATHRRRHLCQLRSRRRVGNRQHPNPFGRLPHGRHHVGQQVNVFRRRRMRRAHLDRGELGRHRLPAHSVAARPGIGLAHLESRRGRGLSGLSALQRKPARGRRILPPHRGLGLLEEAGTTKRRQCAAGRHCCPAASVFISAPNYG